MKGVAVFDAYGTLFDTEGLVTRAEAEAPGHGEALVRMWRAKQLEYTWLRSLLDRYRDFWAVTRDALEFACEAAGLHLSAEARDRLMSAWLDVPAFPDAAPALSDLTARGVRCCVFSNGTRQMLQSATVSSGLNRYLDAVLSVDDGVRVYKPHPAAYEFVCHSLGVPREEVLFVSSNGFDVAGAASYGFPAAWVNRRGLPWERLGVTPHRVVSSLGELGAGWFESSCSLAYSNSMPIRVSVLGASGYTGGELVRLLSGHPQVELVHLTASQHEGRAMGSVFPNLRGVVDQVLEPAELGRIGRDSDVVFLALPHGMALRAAPELLAAGARVVDLGADFRLKDPGAYARWYRQEHTAPELLGEAVYGLTELYRSRVRAARLVANPGCYPTAAVLALAPLVQAGLVAGPVVVDAKSGVSGAGRSPSSGTHFGEVNENVKPYNVGAHRHQPEMEQALAETGAAVSVLFVPHLIPMTRGILATCYAPLARSLSAEEALGLYREAYSGEAFVRVLEDELPQTKATYGSNFCDLTVRVDAERGLAVAVAALDNLVKGGAGQAVQNLNVMFGLPETTGLWAPALFP